MEPPDLGNLRKDSNDHIDSPTAWNDNDKFKYLSLNSDRLRVDYTGKAIGTSC